MIYNGQFMFEGQLLAEMLGMLAIVGLLTFLLEERE